MNGIGINPTPLIPLSARPFLYACFVFWLLGLVLLMVFPKGELVVMINGTYSPFLDLFWKWTTFLGDGIWYGVLIVFFLFIRFSWSLQVVLVVIVQTVIVQGLKRILFAGAPRPTAFFEDSAMLHFVEGVKVNAVNSFPSGHTATAFSIFLLLVMLLPLRPIYALGLFLVAMAVGISRIYLLQHFFGDVYAGSIVGVISVFLGLALAVYVMRKAGGENMWQRSLLRRSTRLEG